MNKTEKIIEGLKTADNQLKRIRTLISQKEQELRVLKNLQATVSSSQGELYKILNSLGENMLLAEISVYKIGPNKKEFMENKIINLLELPKEEKDQLIHTNECTLNVGGLNPANWVGTLYEIKEWL